MTFDRYATSLEGAAAQAARAEVVPAPRVVTFREDAGGRAMGVARLASSQAESGGRLLLVVDRSSEQREGVDAVHTARIAYRLEGLLSSPVALDKSSTSAASTAGDLLGFGRAWKSYVRTLIATWPEVGFQLVLTKQRGVGQRVGAWLVAAASSPDVERATARVLAVHEGLASSHLLLARHVEWAPVPSGDGQPLDFGADDLVELAPRELEGSDYAFAPWFGPGPDVERLAEAMTVWPSALALIVTLCAAEVSALEARTLRRGGPEQLGPNAGELRPEVHVYLMSDARLPDALVLTLGELLLDAPGFAQSAERVFPRDGFTTSRVAEREAFHRAVGRIMRGGAPAVARTVAPPTLRRARFILPSQVAASIFRPPTGGLANLLGARRAPGAPLSLPTVRGARLGEVRFCGVRRAAAYTDADASQHTYVIGRTGTGKTTLLHNFALEWAEAGHGVAVIDPHGDLATDFLASIPSHRQDDVIVFDPTDVDFPIGLNLLEHDARHPAQRSLVINELFRIIESLFNMSLVAGPIFEQYFRFGLLALMDDADEPTDITMLSRVFSDGRFRQRLVARCSNPLVRRFWEDAEKTSGESCLANMAFYITSKLDPLVTDAHLLPIVGQRQSGFCMRAVMDSSAILVVRLNKGSLGARATRLLGMVIVMRALFAAMSRSDQPVAERRPFHLIVDEVQSMLTPTLAELLAEARKFGLRLTLANQNLAQMPEDLRETILGNVGTLVGFRVSPRDAELLAMAMGDRDLAPTLVSLQNYQSVVRALIGGELRAPFSVHTSPPPSKQPEQVARLVAQSRARHARDRASVLAAIYGRHGVKPS